MLSRTVLLLTASVAIVGANSLVLSPVAAAVASSFHGVDAAGVMTAAAIYGLGTAFSALTFAPLADRIGPETSLARSLMVLVAALAASAAAPGLLVLCVAQGVAGVAAGAALPAIYGLSAQVAPKGRESETLGVVLTGWTLSLVAGVSLSAVLADLVHWRAVYLVLAASAVIVASLLRQAADWGTLERAGAVTSPLTALRVPGIGRALMVCAAYMIAFYGLYSYLGAHLQGVLGQSVAAAGLAPLAYGIGFGAAVPLDRMIDRFGAERVSVPAFAALALVYAAMASAVMSFALLVGLCLLWGLLNHLGLNLIVGRLTGLDASQRGAIMGLYSAVTYLGVFAGALFYRPVFEAHGLGACALLSGVCIVLSIGDALGSRRARGQGGA